MELYGISGVLTKVYAIKYIKELEEINNLNLDNKIINRLKKNDWILWGEIVVLGIMIFPVLLISLYSLPAADDFYYSYMMKINTVNGESFGKVALCKAIDFYKQSGGHTFSDFIIYITSPFLRGGLVLLRGVIFAIHLFFYFTLYFFIKFFSNKFFKIENRKLTLLIYILVCFAVINNYNNSEIRTWYCVVVGYVLLIAFMLWGIVFFVQAIQTDKKIWIFAASVTGFLVSGGSLNITALNCGIYLIIGYMGIKWSKKKITSIICFGSSLLGGIINVLSPGNFSRHDSISSGYSIGGALKLSVILVWKRGQYLLFYTPFIVLLIVLFVLAFKYIDFGKSFKPFNPLFILGIVLLGVIIVNFPVCLGYGGRPFPDRCVWVEDCCIYLGIFSWVIYLAGWIKNVFDEIEIRKDIILCIIIGCMLFICSLGSVKSLGDYPTIKMWKQLCNGEASEYAKFWEGIFDEIESRDYKEIVIYREKIPVNELIYAPGLGYSKEYWINSAAAHYYEKDWICIITE